MRSRIWVRACSGALALATLITLPAIAQERPATPQPPAAQGRGRGRGQRGPAVISPTVAADGHITFRIQAPKAENVNLSAGDIPGGGQRSFTKGENDIWELKIGPVNPGAYRYVISVDGVSTVDPHNPSISESNGNVWSLVVVPGSDFMDAKDVPHGAVAAVYYPSSTLGRMRRMHVYTPPGYETSSEKYPVFYLLHGAGDCDDSWTSVGRANFILDNLIAQGKAKPMIVVMPAGHTGPFGAGAPAGRGGPNFGAGGFEGDFSKDIRPYVEKHYRTLTDRNSRAIAGLSMGGAQTLNIAFSDLSDFGYVGVFSSGILSDRDQWETEHKAQLDNASARDGLKLLWFGIGSQDFLLNRCQPTVEMFKQHGFKPDFHESSGGHTWINWRDYLDLFAPQLFR